VLLQPLGHLSVFRINRLRAVERLIIAHAGGGDGPASIAFRFSILGASVGTSPLELCQTGESCPITYGVSALPPARHNGHLWQFRAAGKVVKDDHVTDTAQMIRMAKGK
jgi:hypothetical protein